MWSLDDGLTQPRSTPNISSNMCGIVLKKSRSLVYAFLSSIIFSNFIHTNMRELKPRRPSSLISVLINLWSFIKTSPCSKLAIHLCLRYRLYAAWHQTIIYLMTNAISRNLGTSKHLVVKKFIYETRKLWRPNIGNHRMILKIVNFGRKKGIKDHSLTNCGVLVLCQATLKRLLASNKLWKA